MMLKRFNEKGVAAFSEYLIAVRTDPVKPVPTDLLDKPTLVTALPDPIDAEPKQFKDRLDFVTWLQEAADRAEVRIAFHDQGFWSWLALLLFDQLCPLRKGKRTVGEDARYILSRDWRRRYRHLLATPYRTFQIHRTTPERAGIVLRQPLHVLGEITEQFASRQELISCPGTMGLATHLFVNPKTGHLRRGASGAAARRLGKLLNQYTRTWDVTVMEPARMAELLPAEFNRFKQ